MKQCTTPQARQGAGWSALALATLVLAGCGGGGGGGNAGGGGVVNPPVVNPPAVAEISSTALESSTQPVREVAADIDDNGRVAVLFAQSNGSRIALHAVRGLPNARGTAPAFGAAEVIDGPAPYDGSVGQMGMTLSPNGNALARWLVTAPCTAGAGDCKFVYTARRLRGDTDAWEAPVLAGEANSLPKGIINDAGDIALLWPTQQNNANGVQILGMVWKEAAATQFTAPTVFPDILAPASSSVAFTLDGQGNMVYVSLSTAAGPAAVAVRRGTVSAGFAGTSTETLGAQATGEAQLENIWAGTGGQVVLTWTQPRGSQLRAATLDSVAGAWQETALGASRNSQRLLGAVAGNGDFVRYELDTCMASRRRGGAWLADAALPSGTCSNAASYTGALARNGNLFSGLVSATAATGNTGQWLHYNAAQNALTQTLGTAYLFGTPSTVGGQLLLSENGVAALVSRNDYDVLPTAAAAGGTRGVANNAWVTYVKLP